MKTNFTGNTQGETEPGCCLRQRICEHFELPDFSRMTACMLYHTVTRSINFSDTVLIKAGYGVTLRYLDKKGTEKSNTKEGSVLFFGLPADFLDHDYTVYLPNPLTADACDDCVNVEFCAALCLDDD